MGTDYTPLEQSNDATAPAAGADPIPEGLPGRTDTLLDGQARRDCPTPPWGACITVLDSHPRFDAHPPVEGCSLPSTVPFDKRPCVGYRRVLQSDSVCRILCRYGIPSFCAPTSSVRKPPGCRTSSRALHAPLV